MTDTPPEIPPVQLLGEPIGISIEPTQHSSSPRIDAVGARYHLSNSLPSDVSIEDQRFPETILNEAKEHVTTLIRDSNRQARWYRIASTAGKFVTVISGVVVAVLNTNSSEGGSQLASLILGVSIATIQSLMTVFNVEKNTALAAETYKKALSIRRTIISLRNQKHIEDGMIMPLAAELDELSMNLYNGKTKDG